MSNLAHIYFIFQFTPLYGLNQEILGHSNVNVTLGTYTQVLEKQKTRIASLIDALYDTEEKTNIISFG